MANYGQRGVRCLILAAAAATGVSQAPRAAASTRATVEFLNGNLVSNSESSIDEPEYDVRLAQLSFGFVSAGAATGPGALSAQTLVSIDVPTGASELVFGSWRARSQADKIEQIAVGTKYCGATCVEAAALGVDSIVITFDVHAAGSVAAFKSDQNFGRSDASVGFAYTLTSSQQSVTNGGSKSSRTEPCNLNCPQTFNEGAIASSSGTLMLRPGELLELRMNATTAAEVSVPTQSASDPKPSAGTALSDFSNTLEWRGVTAVQAFDANGDQVSLTPGGRFTMIGVDTGHDYWFRSPGVDRELPNPDGSERGEGGAGGEGGEGGGSSASGGTTDPGGGSPGEDDGGATGAGASDAGGRAGRSSGGAGNRSGGGSAGRGGGGDGAPNGAAGETDSVGGSGGAAGRGSSSGGTGARRGTPTSDDGGCGCRTTRSAPPRFGAVTALLLVLSLVRRRRARPGEPKLVAKSAR
jgi:MYXO-CTERM domain-containing protein